MWIPQMKTLRLLCSSDFHNFLQESTTLAINLCPYDPKWLLKRKEKKPFLSLTQTNPRYRDFHYRFQSQCNCQITAYTKVHANPLHAIIIFIHHMDSQNLLHYPRSSPILLPPRLMAGHCIFASWVCEPTTFLDWTYYIVHSENLSYNEIAQLELHQTKLYSITYIYKFVIMSISD